MSNEPNTVTTAVNRLRHAQVLLCDGGCCGRVEPRRGTAVVPLAHLRARWKAEQLTPAVSLAVTSCLGPCDVANVCCIITAAGTQWLGRLDESDYDRIADWAGASRAGVVPLPAALLKKRFQRWQ